MGLLPQFISKLPRLIIWLSVIIILALSVLLAFEKVLFLDNAYMLFNLINLQSFQIAHNRLVMYPFQILPYLGVKSGLGVSTLIYLFSINLFLIYLILALVCQYVLNNTRAALGICLSMFVGLANNFFITTEVLHGIVICFLLLAYLKKYAGEMNLQRYFVLAILIFPNVFGHPITLITTAYALFYFLLVTKKDALGTPIKVFSVFIIFVVIKKYAFPENGYEQGFLDELKNAKTLIGNFFNLHSTNFFFNSVKLYLPFFLLSALNCYFLIQRKQYKLFSLYALTSLSYFVIACLIFNKGDSYAMTEREFLPLMFFAVLIFIFEVWQDKLIYHICLFSIILYGAINIYKDGKFYSERITYMDQIYRKIENTPHQKFYTFYSEMPQEKYFGTWSISVEFLLYSSVKNNLSPKTLFFFGDEIPKHYDLNNPRLFLCPYWGEKEKLDTLIFPIAPQPYQYLNITGIKVSK